MTAFAKDWVGALVAISVVAAALIAGLLVRRRLFRQLTAWARNTKWEIVDEVIASLRRPVLLWFLILGLYAASRVVEVPARLAPLADRALMILLVVSLTLWLSDLAVRLLRLAARGREPVAVTGLAQYVVRAAVYALGGLVLLQSLGISVTPLLTTLGIGGVAVALGLQETLANLFAGLHITLARNIRVGDFIRLESGEEGYVDDIGWRTTRVRMLPGNMVLIPNARLAQSVVTNYHQPAKDLAVLIQVGVHYRSDLQRVEQVTCEVGREVMRGVQGGLPEFEPFIRYHTFGESSINFTVILRAREFVDQYLVKHEFIKRLHARYTREGIVIPYPIRAVNIQQEGADQALARARARPGDTGHAAEG